MMYLIVGLGNPGDEYVDTPHNAGFRFVESIREFFGYDSLFEVSDWEYDKYMQSDISVCEVNDADRVILAKPRTFMNRSGFAVRSLLKKYELDEAKSMILIHDDLDIKLGEYKIQRTRAPHGHKGVESIHNNVNNKDFLRIRLGVDDRKDVKIPGEDYVLMKYSEDQLVVLDEVIAESIKSLRRMITI